MSEFKEIKGGKKYKLVPPDGGWGYLIWVSVIISNTTIQVLLPCFGLIFNDFMVELNMGSTSVTLLNGINGIFIAVAGYTTGPLSKKFSWRQICILASLLMNVGCVGTYFAKSQLTFYVFQATQYAGCGYLFNITCTQINYYFLKKRLLSMSFTQTIPALLLILAPMFFKWSLDEYGFRGTLILVVGIAMQNFIAAVLLQPVEWHMKKVPIDDDNDEEEQLFNNAAMMKNKGKDDGVIVKITLKEPTISENENYNTKKETEQVIYDFESPKSIEKPKSFLKNISDALDLPLFKNLAVVSVTLGTSLIFFGESTFGMMLPQALYSQHWTESSVAWSLTLMAIGDVATKIALMALNNFFIKLGYRPIIMAGLILAVVTRIGMLWSKEQVPILIYLTVMGSSRCLITTLAPLVLSEAVPQDKYANIMGMFMLLYAVIGLAVGPVIGAIGDLTNSYATSFCILTSMYLIVFMFWSIEMCYMRNKKKELRQRRKSQIGIKAK